MIFKNVLAVYDISDETRLSKVAKTIENYGTRVQKSVFELNISIPKLKELHEKINNIIDNAVDSVRYYILCEEDWQKRESMGISPYNEPDWDKRFLIV